MISFVSLILLIDLPFPNWKMVESLDSDQNNKITLAEFTSEPNIFESIDTNNDQVLTQLEVKAAYKKNLPIPKIAEPAPEVSAYDPKTKNKSLSTIETNLLLLSSGLIPDDLLLSRA